MSSVAVVSVYTNEEDKLEKTLPFYDHCSTYTQSPLKKTTETQRTKATKSDADDDDDDDDGYGYNDDDDNDDDDGEEEEEDFVNTSVMQQSNCLLVLEEKQQG